MIIDLTAFISAERPGWSELEAMLARLENDPAAGLTLEQLQRFHYLYQRTSAGLAKLITNAYEPETQRYLESLIARAYGEIHETRAKPHRFTPFRFLLQTFPRAFRGRIGAFWLSLGVTLLGCAFGVLALSIDPEAKGLLLPYGHGQMDPSERVHEEESATEDRLEGQKSAFSAQLMTHNTQVAIFTLALGISWGVGSIIMLFYNGVILGALCFDYILAGQWKFLAGWLLPHGVIEIPAILLAGQAGLVLAGALIGWGTRDSLRQRMRAVTGDLFALICGVAAMLVWAGVVEAFLSQYHEPVIPYDAKIAFGLMELAGLIAFLSLAGRKVETTGEER
jgi:uncharacterized membrane protein SpoIIM required for sporulation